MSKFPLNITSRTKIEIVLKLCVVEWQQNCIYDHKMRTQTACIGLALEAFSFTAVVFYGIITSGL